MTDNLPLIFVHGIKGASLRTPGQPADWLPGSVALGLRTPDLALPTEWQGDRQGHDGREPSGVLERVDVIPLVGQDVYGHFLESVRAAGASVHPFAYDWRRDNFESAARLTSFVEAVRARHGGAEVRIVAHSMGGLVTLSAMHQGLAGVHSVCFVGVPFGGGIGFLDDLHFGTKTGLNARVLAPRVMATFASAFVFFPLDGSGFYDESGNAIPVDLYDVASWKRQRLGVYASDEGASAELTAHLVKALARGKAFRELLYRTLPAYPPILVVRGAGQPTLDRLTRVGSAEKPRWDREAAPKVAGDGRVRAPTAVPPEGVPCVVRDSSLEHVALPNDAAVLAWVRGA